MHGVWFRFSALVLVLSLLFSHNAFPLQAQQLGARQSVYFASPQDAFRAALDAYRAHSAKPYVIRQSGQNGKLAYATAVNTENGDDYFVMLASAEATAKAPANTVTSEQGWKVLVPGESPAVEYNQLLAAFPDSLIDESSKAVLRLEEPAGSPFSEGPSGANPTMANYTGHKLPWPYGKPGYVTQKDTPGHISQVDFDIQGLAANGDVYASKPGTVVFVKQSSNTTCKDALPSLCWKKANMVVIRHSSGEYSWYVHLAYHSVPVAVGQNVWYGTKIGVEGQTGYSFGVHLHYMASSGYTPAAWTDPNNPNDAPWATGIIPVDFDEYPWASLIESYADTYTSKNAANLPTACPAAGGVLLYRDAQYGCAKLGESSGYVLRTGLGFQNVPPSFNDSASAIRIPAGESVAVYENADRGGERTCFTANTPGQDDFSKVAWDNRVSSFEVFPTPDCPAADLTAPTGSLSGPPANAAVGRAVQLTALASDSQSGVQLVRFTAKWGGQQRVVYTGRSSPYTYTWDLCSSGVPDGDIELGLEVVDNAWNSFTAASIHVSKTYNCASPGEPTSVSCDPDQWCLDYWGNASLSGSAVIHRNEGETLAHAWSSAAPDALFPALPFSSRAVRSANFDNAVYRFHISTGGGLRFWLDGVLRIDHWAETAAVSEYTYDVFVGPATVSHTLKVEHFETGAPTALNLWWEKLSDTQVPQVSITAPGGYLTTNTINIQASASDAASGISHMQFFAGYAAGGGWDWHSLDWDLDGSDGWSKTWDASGIPDQAKVSFFVQAWDRAGNSNGSWSADMPLDRTPPTAAVTPLAAAQDSSRFLVQWSLSDNITGVDHWDVQYQVDGSAAWQNWLVNQKGAARSAWFTGQMGHDYAFRIRAGDAAGNLSAFSAPTPPTHVNTCAADDFEPDNDKDHARTLPVDGQAETHKICGADDLDWFAFEASAGKPYLIYTDRLGLTTDTVLTLYAADGTTVLAENDNRGSGSLASGIIWTPGSDGLLYFRVRHSDPLVAGDAVTYNIAVASAAIFYLPVVGR